MFPVYGYALLIEYNLSLILVYFSLFFIFPSSSLLSDFCHFFHFLSCSVLLVHTRVAWKILCFVSSHSYIWAHKLILSYNKQRFIMLPSLASWWAATHWGVILNSWSPLANPPILLFFPFFPPTNAATLFFFSGENKRFGTIKLTSALSPNSVSSFHVCS